MRQAAKWLGWYLAGNGTLVAIVLPIIVWGDRAHAENHQEGILWIYLMAFTAIAIGALLIRYGD